MTMRNHLVLSIILSLAGAACAGSQKEQVRDAHNEHIDDNTVARTQAIEDREQAKVDNIDRHRESTKDEIDAQSDTHAQQDIKDAKNVVDSSSDRATYQTKAVARIQTIGVRLDAAQEKLKALGTTAPKNDVSEIESLRKEHSLLTRDLNALPEVPAVRWEAEHEALDKRISELNRRVKLLTDAIEDA
ncbi:MAG TPA: hypothetical protein VFN67_21015 [Polyangiales bacterium]|jgi:hypothetical protein|nr:hypothetical protein [Polyangiales bacterium]